MKTTLLLATCFANYIALWIDNFDTNIDIDSIERIMFSSFWGENVATKSRQSLWPGGHNKSICGQVRANMVDARQRKREKEGERGELGRIETLTSSSQGNSQRCH